MSTTALRLLLDKAMASRQALLNSLHESAFRLFNGFTEGCPDLVIDVYARTLVLYNHADDPKSGESIIEESLQILTSSMNWLHAGIVKIRNGRTRGEKCGVLLFGSSIDGKIREHGIGMRLN